MATPMNRSGHLMASSPSRERAEKSIRSFYCNQTARLEPTDDPALFRIRTDRRELDSWVEVKGSRWRFVIPKTPTQTA